MKISDIYKLKKKVKNRLIKEVNYLQLLRTLMIQGGNLKNADDGINFENEKLGYSLLREGLIAMGNYGTNNNGYFITLKNCYFLNGICVDFVWLFKGMDVVKEAGEVETYVQSKSKIDIVIENCGEINILLINASKYIKS